MFLSVRDTLEINSWRDSDTGPEARKSEEKKRSLERVLKTICRDQRIEKFLIRSRPAGIQCNGRAFKNFLITKLAKLHSSFMQTETNWLWCGERERLKKWGWLCDWIVSETNCWSKYTEKNLINVCKLFRCWCLDKWKKFILSHLLFSLLLILLLYLIKNLFFNHISQKSLMQQNHSYFLW